jgi:hypothetical protein
VIFLFTTNVPHVVDPAFLRRAGGTTERFGRLGRRAFLAVLHKHLSGLPFRGEEGADEAAARAWLHSNNEALGGAPGTLIQSVPGLVHVVGYLDARRALI